GHDLQTAAAAHRAQRVRQLRRQVDDDDQARPQGPQAPSEHQDRPDLSGPLHGRQLHDRLPLRRQGDRAHHAQARILRPRKDEVFEDVSGYRPRALISRTTPEPRSRVVPHDEILATFDAFFERLTVDRDATAATALFAEDAEIWMSGSDLPEIAIGRD